MIYDMKIKFSNTIVFNKNLPTKREQNKNASPLDRYYYCIQRDNVKISSIYCDWETIVMFYIARIANDKKFLIDIRSLVNNKINYS